LLLHGGPGGIGGTRAVWADIMQLPLARKRDVATFDMRGVGDSEPNRKLCPELGPKVTPAFNPTKEKWEETYRAAIRECVASLDAQGFDRSAYGPDVSAADAIDLRHALGYEKWDLYGASYGGIVAQEMMRRDPQATHAVVLLSAYPAGSPDYTAKFVWMFQQNLYHVFAECAAQPHCQRAFPTLRQDFVTLFEELSAKPVQVPIRGSSPPRTVLLNGERLLLEVRREFRNPGSIRRLPLLINEMRRGDRAAAFERLIGDGVIPPGGALGSLVQCNEAGARYSAALAAMRPKLQHPFEMIAADVRDECAIWIANPAHQIDQTPMASSIPILVLHGEFDPMDNPTTQLQLKAHSKQAYAYVFPGETHANPAFGCHGSIVQQFLENPTRTPDASCIARMPRILFSTRSFQPSATFVIRDAANTRTPFAGTWEANLNFAPDWTIELLAEGNVVRGTVLEDTLPIRDGSINGQTMSFKVNSADGARTFTFSATLVGDELRFTREVTILRTSRASPFGLFGGPALRMFVAKRVR
jgi:pimeloyl-ACP methyl ester carboxylesterase